MNTQQQIQQLEKEIKERNAKIEELKKLNEPWKPEIFSSYFNMWGDFRIWKNDEFDNYLLEHGLVFPALEAHEKWSKVARIGKQIKDAVMVGNAMFKAHIEFIWVIRTNCSIGSVSIGNLWDGCHIIETTSEQSAEHVIEVVGKEDIIYYLKNWR